MEHTPPGYIIKDGIVTVNEAEAEQIRILYAAYLSGLSYASAAKAAGITARHTGIKRIMQNRKYLGSDRYPAIIDEETFNAAEAERQRREVALGRDDLKRKVRTPPKAATSFRQLKTGVKYKDPIKQAEYAYGQIREVKE